MRRRAPGHFRRLLAEHDTVARQLLARAIYSERYGDVDEIDSARVRDIARELDQEVYSSEEALALLEKTEPVGLPRQLRELRRAAGLTQVQLAERVGIAQSQISGYESGARQPSLDTLQALATELGPITIHGGLEDER